jgi:hypothetical protein
MYLQEKHTMKKIFNTLFICILAHSISAQKEKDSVSTEVINVVTSYRPTISDAFKASENPIIETKTREKNKLEYTINSTPIKSVFTPNTGGYKSAKTIKNKKGYPNYIKAGYGNYGTPLVEGFLYKRKKEHEAQFFLFNKASNGGIDGVPLNDNYLNTKIELNYKNTQRKQTWETTIGYHRDIYNWYGIPSEYEQAVLNNIEEEQIYNQFFIHGKINLHTGNLKSIEASLSAFSDAFDSKETTINIAPSFEFPLKENKFVTTFNLAILNGKFKKEYTSSSAINYGFLAVGADAYYPIQKENIYLSIGAKIIYNTDLENNDSNFYVYPDIHIDYVVIDELVNAYGGITGGLIQNSYKTIASENPYVSPTLDIKPTSNSFRVFAGVKGKLTATISYDVKASYAQENDKLLFRSNKNFTDGSNLVNNGYEAGNSFFALYDNVRTFGFFGELKATLTKNIETGASLTINSYTTDTEAEAWNLPPFAATVFGTYQYKKWSGKAELFAIGKRKDLLYAKDDIIGTPISLDGYLDLNISANYAFNRKWSAFLELNNVFNNNYEVYSNYQVQGFQILAGAIYSFDF